MDGIELKISEDKALDFFHSALCNGLGYVGAYGIYVNPNKRLYDEAKAKLENPCLEDVFIQMLRDGNTLQFINEEDEDVFDISLSDVVERMALVEVSTLLDMIQENDDAVTADCIIQTILYKEVIFG